MALMMGNKMAPNVQLSYVDMQSDYEQYSQMENGFEFFSDRMRSKVEYPKNQSSHDIDTTVHLANSAQKKESTKLEQTTQSYNQPLKKFKT